MRICPSPLPLCELTQLDIHTKPLTAEDTSPDQAFHIVFGQLCPFNILARCPPSAVSHRESSRVGGGLPALGWVHVGHSPSHNGQSLGKVREPTPSHDPTLRQPVPTPQQPGHGSRDKNVTPKPSHMHGCRKPTLQALHPSEIPFPGGEHRGHFPAPAPRAGGEEHTPRG